VSWNNAVVAAVHVLGTTWSVKQETEGEERDGRSREKIS